MITENILFKKTLILKKITITLVLFNILMLLTAIFRFPIFKTKHEVFDHKNSF